MLILSSQVPVLWSEGVGFGNQEPMPYEQPLRVKVCVGLGGRRQAGSAVLWEGWTSGLCREGIPFQAMRPLQRLSL